VVFAATSPECFNYDWVSRLLDQVSHHEDEILSHGTALSFGEAIMRIIMDSTFTDFVLFAVCLSQSDCVELFAKQRRDIAV
jgi:hypothetical protein